MALIPCDTGEGLEAGAMSGLMAGAMGGLVAGAVDGLVAGAMGGSIAGVVGGLGVGGSVFAMVATGFRVYS